MNIGVIIYSDDPETVWNAFRFGNWALKEGNEVEAFLMGRGVEAEHLDTDKFNVTEQINSFVDAGGELLACGICLEVRKSESGVCPIATMKDMYDVVMGNDKVLTF
ncbi:MAG: DsrE family protein [Archaeoglobaceae archaeon]